MQYKTSGIILHTTKYGDNATIVSVYTHQFGKTSYMVYGLNKKKSMIRSAFFQPLSLVEIDIFHHQSKDIQRIKDIRIKFPTNGISSDPIKNAIALFIAEILFRTLNHTEGDDNSFKFLENSIQILDCSEDGLANFHLIFISKLCRYLGFEPNQMNSALKYFDMQNGIFTSEKPYHAYYLDTDLTVDFAALFAIDYSTMHNLKFTRERRNLLLDSLLDYYKLHVPNFHGLNSLAVCHTLFD